MKILQATTAIGWSGGTEQCLLLTKYMNLEGEETHILTYRGSELDERAEKLKIKRVYIPNTKRISFSETKKLARIIENYDIVNTHISKAHWFIWLASFLTRKRPRIVYTRRVSYGMPVFSLLTKYNVHTDAVICVTDEIKKRISSILKQKKVVYIPSGIELDRFNTNIRSNIREELKIPENSTIITNVGNFSNVKGQHLLLPAFKMLMDRFKGERIYLLLVGRDTKGGEARKLMEKYRLNKNVLPLGFRRDIPEILKATDIFAFPSLSEGIAGSLLQAMAMGKICVTSSVGGIKSYAENGINAITVAENDVDSLYNGLAKALSLNKDKRKVMSKEAIKTARKFDIRAVAEKTLDLYRELYGISKTQRL